MIVGILILVVAAAAALYAWPKAAPAPECIAVIKEVAEWCVYDDGSVSEVVEYCEIFDPAECVEEDYEVTDLGEW